MASELPEQQPATTKPTSGPSKSKKRKLSSAPPAAVDSRFSFAAEDLDDGPSATAASDHEGEEEGEEDNELGDALAGPLTSSNPLPAHLLPSKAKAHGTPGLIYLSRIPPGMGPSKVKHLLSAYGEVGRVFLARSGAFSLSELWSSARWSYARVEELTRLCAADPDPPQNLSSRKRQKDKHREHRFAEGWVEFMNKKVARSVAEMLNANTIGAYFSFGLSRPAGGMEADSCLSSQVARRGTAGATTSGR